VSFSSFFDDIDPDGLEDISPEDIKRAEAKPKPVEGEKDCVFDELMRGIDESNSVYFDSRLLDSLAFHRRDFQVIPPLFVKTLFVFLAIAAAISLPAGRFDLAGFFFVALLFSLWFRNFLKQYPRKYSVDKFFNTYKQDGTLRLNSKRLSDAVFQFFGRYRGWVILHLDELETLTPQAAKLLADFHGPLSTSGLIFLLPEAEAELVKRSIWEKPVGCRRLCSDVLTRYELGLVIAQHYVSGRDMVKIVDAIDSGEDLRLSLPTITVELAELFVARCQGKWILDNLTTISPEARKILRENPNIQLPPDFEAVIEPAPVPEKTPRDDFSGDS
jgi:hypothetical protein